jgi:hypothetical protein
MIIHGADDRRFPQSFALKLKASLPPDRVDLFVAAGARHSESSFDPAYPGAVRKFIARHLGGMEDDRPPV